MPKYKFLTEEWVAEAKAISEAHAHEASPPTTAVRANLVITEVPFGEGSIDAHLDTSGGDTKMDLGHLDSPDLTISIDYESARAIFVDSNQAAGMQAFTSGKLLIDPPDKMMLLMQMQMGTATPAALKVAEEIKAITE